MNTTVAETTFRRFLLGIANEQEESLVEQAILAGEVDALWLEDLEDQLIDDFVLGSIAPEEKDAFIGHFLAADERRQRLTLATELVSYARRHAAQASSMAPKPPPVRVVVTPLFWRRSTLFAAAASILLAALVGFEQIKLRRQVEIASETRNELTRLQRAMTSGKSSPSLHDEMALASPIIPQAEASRIPSLEFAATTRSVLPLLLRIPDHAQFVRMDAKLSLPLAKKYREVVLNSSGEQLWAQEFPASTLSPVGRSTIALPASILPPGLYHFQIERGSSAGHFELSEDHVFRVIRG